MHFIEALESGKSRHIVCYGCSLTADGAWVTQLRNILNRRYPGLVTVTNSGENGMWSRWGLENLKERVVAKSPDVVFIEFSMNDAYFPYRTSLEEIQDNLNAMIDRIFQAKSDTEIIIMVMNPPVGEHLAIRPDILNYNQVYRDVAGKRNLFLIDHYSNWVRILEKDSATFERYVPDGIHPNELGSRMVTTPHILSSLGLL